MREWLVLFVLLPVGVSDADRVELITGEVLRGEIIQGTADRLVLDHPILGRLEIPRNAIEQVVDLPPASAESPATTTTDDDKADDGSPSPKTVPPTPQPEASPKPRWDSTLELGFVAHEGNTEDANVLLAVNSSLDRGYDRYTFDSRYSLRTSRGDRSENKLTAGLLTEWPLPPSRWSYFAQTRYDFDEFQSWETRLTGGGGVGYHLIDINDVDKTDSPIDVFDLHLRIGLGLRREFGSMNERIQPEGIFGGNLVWQITEHQRFAAGSTFFPNLDESGEFRVVTSAEWVLDLNTFDGLSLKLGLAHEHQSLTDPGIEHNDISIYGAFVLDF